MQIWERRRFKIKMINAKFFLPFSVFCRFGGDARSLSEELPDESISSLLPLKNVKNQTFSR